jgi:glycosyltransferase involved in cell wall biosynthesis
VTEPVAPEPTVSIVIPALDEDRAIEGCLQALLAQSYPAELLEIIVVDGGSRDRTREIVRGHVSRDSRVLLLANPGRSTPMGMNIGLRAAKGQLVGLMSAHAEAAIDYLERAVQALRSTGAWAVGGRIQRVATTPTARAIAAVTSSPFGVGNAAHNYADHARWVETAFPGLWPKWVFDRIGSFDEELARNQDDELNFRVREAGGRIWYDPSIVVRYESRATYRALFSQYRQYGYWKVRVFQKHPRAARWRHLVPAAWVGLIIVSSAAAAVIPTAAVLSVVSLGSYGLIIGRASVRLRQPGLSTGRVLVAFLTLHVGYGMGFWQGLVVHVLARRLAGRSAGGRDHP